MDLSPLLSSVGAACGIAGVVIGVLAKLDSKKANDIAERSYQAALDSNALADEANRIAVDARQLAEEANTISLRSEQRDTEVNRVSWNYNWIDPSTCKITNTGTDEAFRVYVSVTVDGEHITAGPVDVKAGNGVCVALPKLRDKLRRDEAEFRAEEAAAERAYNPFGINVTPPLFWPPLKFDVVITIQWLTPLGKQREKVFQETGRSF